MPRGSWPRLATPAKFDRILETTPPMSKINRNTKHHRPGDRYGLISKNLQLSHKTVWRRLIAGATSTS